MPKVPSSILKMLIDLPEQQVDIVCRNLKITETTEFKKYLSNNITANKSCKDFLIKELSSSNTTTIQAIYSKIEGFLFIGGCAPGVGIAFNILDACFCFALGNMFGCFVAIISCFPIPGFKVAGKGLEKILVALLRKISPTKLSKFTKELIKKLKNFYGPGIENSGMINKALQTIRIQLEEIIIGLRNPFAEEIIRFFAKIVDTLPPKLSNNIQKGVSQSYSMSYKQTNLLKITERSIK